MRKINIDKLIDRRIYTYFPASYVLWHYLHGISIPAGYLNLFSTVSTALWAHPMHMFMPVCVGYTSEHVHLRLLKVRERRWAWTSIVVYFLFLFDCKYPRLYRRPCITDFLFFCRFIPFFLCLPLSRPCKARRFRCIHQWQKIQLLFAYI